MLLLCVAIEDGRMERKVKYIKQFMIILSITFIGELLNQFLPFPVPASIYGLVILFLCLETGFIKAGHIRETAMWLVDMIPLMFVPAGAGLLKSWGVLQPILIPVSVITVVSTIVVMVVSGWVTQGVIRLQKKNKNAKKKIAA